MRPRGNAVSNADILPCDGSRLEVEAQNSISSSYSGREEGDFWHGCLQSTPLGGLTLGFFEYDPHGMSPWDLSQNGSKMQPTPPPCQGCPGKRTWEVGGVGPRTHLRSKIYFCTRGVKEIYLDNFMVFFGQNLRGWQAHHTWFFFTKLCSFCHISSIILPL